MLAAALTPTPVLPVPAPPAPQTRCVVEHPRLVELSGMAVDAGGLWAMTDGGHRVAVHRLDGAGGSACRITDTRTADIDPFDAEDLALGPDGTLWVADVAAARRAAGRGDRLRGRRHVAVRIGTARRCGRGDPRRRRGVRAGRERGPDGGPRTVHRGGTGRGPAVVEPPAVEPSAWLPSAVGVSVAVGLLVLVAGRSVRRGPRRGHPRHR